MSSVPEGGSSKRLLQEGVRREVGMFLLHRWKQSSRLFCFKDVQYLINSGNYSPPG